MKCKYVYVRLSNLPAPSSTNQGSADFQTHFGQPINLPPNCRVAVSKVNFERNAVVTPTIDKQLFVLIPELNLKNFAIRPASNNQTNKSSVVFSCGNMGDAEGIREEEPFEKNFYDLENNSTLTFNSMSVRIVNERGIPATSFLTNTSSVDLIFETCEE